MVTGLEHFLRTFHDMTDAFILIGGAACELWMNAQGGCSLAGARF
jgi:hypothetical protein